VIWLLLLGCSPCGGRASVTWAGEAPVCADVLTRDADRRRGLMGRPPLGADEGLLLRARRDTRLCITTADMAYDLDVVFAASDGTIRSVACGRGPDDPTVCAEGVRDVLELRPRSRCDRWVGGRLEVD
jgi:uncharacterized membrane protein (UPF0127 family)